MFAVCETIASPAFTNGGANGSAPASSPSRKRIIAAMPPFALGWRATST